MLAYEFRGARALHALHEFATKPIKSGHVFSPARSHSKAMSDNQVMRGQLLCVCSSDLTFYIFFAFFVLQTLLIDGYISQTFRSLAAEKYFLNLLKSTSIPAHATSSNTEKEDYFFVYSQIVPPHMLARTPNPPDRWLLDRGVADGGTVIPQTMWSPRSAADKRQHVETAELLMPVFFENNLKDEGPGLSLRTCINGRCRVLGNPTVPAPVGQKTTTHIRIVVSVAFGWSVVTSDSFTVNISGLAIKSSSGKSHFMTSRKRAVPSPWPSSLCGSGGLWIIFFGSVVLCHT